MQSYLSTPKFIKNFCYKEPNSVYHHFCNAFAYRQIVLIKNPNYNCEILFREVNIKWKEYKKNKNIKEIIEDFFNTSIPIQGFPVLHTRCSSQTVNNSPNTTNITVQLPIQQPDELP